VSAFSIVGMLE